MIGWLAPMLFFVPLVVAEALVRGHLPFKDTAGNIFTYAGYLLIVGSLGLVLFELYASVHDYALFDLGPYWLDPHNPRFYLTWGALFLLDDLTFYVFHRSSHRLRLLWASHVTHHSSQEFNLSVGLRQTWTPFVAWPFWLPLCLLGFDPVMVMATQAASLTYQALLHSEAYDLPRPLNLLLNSPGHHRVHHAQDERYVDKNFGGVLIVWDRLFGTFAPLESRPHYGIGRPVAQFPLIIGLHGWFALFTKEKSS